MAHHSTFLAQAKRLKKRRLSFAVLICLLLFVAFLVDFFTRQ
ncbi:MAG: hypothetical protein V6Z78_04955 [Holosporaceae bacterium]